MVSPMRLFGLQLLFGKEPQPGPLGFRLKPNHPGTLGYRRIRQARFSDPSGPPQMIGKVLARMRRVVSLTSLLQELKRSDRVMASCLDFPLRAHDANGVCRTFAIGHLAKNSFSIGEESRTR